MAKFVTLNGSGKATGFFDSNIATPPSGAVAINNAEYDALLSGSGTTTFIGGALGSVAAIAPSLSDSALAQNALGAGLAITSTCSAGALNGTYALDTTTMSLAADLAALIAANSCAFPGGASTWSWPDAAGALHVFPSAAQFVAFYHALATYRLELFAVIWSNTGSLPSATATIA